jgi:hypothetical protein
MCHPFVPTPELRLAMRACKSLLVPVPTLATFQLLALPCNVQQQIKILLFGVIADQAMPFAQLRALNARKLDRSMLRCSRACSVGEALIKRLPYPEYVTEASAADEYSVDEENLF